MGDLERGEMNRGELGIVVEHLLEVRDEPEPVGRVAVIAAGQVVADAAAGHAVERQPTIFSGSVASLVRRAPRCS